MPHTDVTRGATTTATKGWRKLWNDVACLRQVWAPTPKRLLPLLGPTAIISILGIKLHQTLIVLMRSFWLIRSFYPMKNSPCCSSSNDLSPFHALCPYLLWSSVINRNCWISNILFTYHDMGTPCVLTFDLENMAVPSLESSQYRWRGSLFIWCYEKV